MVKKLLDEAKVMLAISRSFVCASLFIAIGYALFDSGNYEGVALIIIGYEFARKATKLVWQHCDASRGKDE